MFYIIYKTTNKINGKIYIGKHQTQNLYDGYLGSGKLLKSAIQKYGIENFVKEILFIFDTELEMNEKETELVNETFVKEDTNYNLCQGGHGGFGYLNNVFWVGEKLQERRRKVAEKLKGNENCAQGGKKTGSKNMTDAHKAGKIKQPNHTGRKRSADTRKNISNSMKGKGIGESNSQFGTIWITNGIESKKIPKQDVIPLGWSRGRKKTTILSTV